MDAYRASREHRGPGGTAAQAASLAAASAFTHPFRDANQAKHILGPAVYAALALEAASSRTTGVADDEIALAARTAPVEVVELLRKMPTQVPGQGRVGVLFCELDRQIRDRSTAP
jgi:hypothetical protein